MHFWIREVFGALLVALGLFVFYIVVQMLFDSRAVMILQAGPMIVIGFIIFRGGIHLLKVAVAARICLAADRALRESAQGRRPSKAATTLDTSDW